MAGFKAVLLNEMDKILKKKKIIASTLLATLTVIIGQIAVMVVKNNLGLRVAGTDEFPIVVLSVFTYTLLPLFTTFVAIDVFSGEFASNTMKITLVRPVSRFGVFSGKILSIALFIIINLIFVMILSLILGVFFNNSTITITGFFRILVSYLATFLPIFIFSLLVVLLTNVFRGGLPVFLLSVLIFIAFNAFGVMFSRYSSFFITSMFDWYKLWISEFINVFKILRQLLIMLGLGAMLFSAGYYLFDKKDV